MVDQIAPTNILTGVTTVITAGTAVVLGIGTVTRTIVIRAHETNTGLIFVGNIGVSAANGYRLNPGESVSLSIALRSTVYIDAAVNGESVSYLAVL